MKKIKILFIFMCVFLGGGISSIIEEFFPKNYILEINSGERLIVFTLFFGCLTYLFFRKLSKV